MKLCFSCRKFPSPLSIEGVEQRGQYPVAAGGFGDIYKAVYQSKAVAVKQLRFYETDTDHARQKKWEVSMIIESSSTTELTFSLQKLCREALLWKNLNHPFILPFIGLYSDGRELIEGDLGMFSVAMICPWMSNGTIIKYLQDRPSTEVDVFVCFCLPALRSLTSI